MIDNNLIWSEINFFLKKKITKEFRNLLYCFAAGECVVGSEASEGKGRQRFSHDS